MNGPVRDVATIRQRTAVLLFAALLCAFAALAYANADRQLAAQPAFLPAFATAVVITDLITAYLVFAHAPSSSRGDMRWLGAAYVYSAGMVVAQMLVFPGVLAARGLFGAGPQSAIWLWVLWHGGFPAFVIVAMLAAKVPAAQRAMPPNATILTLFVVALVAGFEVLVTSGQTLLPNLIVNNDYTTLSVSLAGRAVLALNMIALAALALATRGRTLLDLGLLIAVLASLIDAALTLRAGSRFSVGWYLARVSSTISAFSVLLVYLREATWLYARVTRLNVRLEQQARIDVTTGIYNRRHFNQQLDIALRDGARRGEPVSLLIIDVDHFKLYNDRYGHLAGDECLRRVAQAIAAAIRRPHDVAARYGGEEFAVILPNTTAAGARNVADMILQAVAAMAIAHDASPTHPTLTISMGMYTAPANTGFETLIGKADTALYDAKQAGRNRASVAVG